MAVCKGCDKPYPDDKMTGGKCPGCVEKSTGAGATNPAVIAAEDLEKSMAKIEAMAAGATPAARKQALLKKALESDLSAEEKTELSSLIKGDKPAGEGADLAKALTPEGDGALNKALDVSDALGELVDKLSKALGEVGDRVSKSAEHQGEFNLVLAKALLDSSRLVLQNNALVKGLSDEVASYSAQPAHGRRTAAGPSQVVEKSHGGGAAAEDQVTKAEIQFWLGKMTDEHAEKGGNFLAPCGEDLTKAVAKLEATGDVSPALIKDVAKFRAKSKSNGAG